MTDPVLAPREGKVMHDAAPTSAKAARAVAVKSGSQRAQVLRVLLRDGPLTDLGIQAGTGLGPDSERPRRVELVEMGLVGDHHEARLPNGNGATAWYLTEKGIAWCREQGWRT